MSPSDLIYNAVYKGALEKKAPERSAKDAAVLAVSDYKKGKFKKIDELIKSAIRGATK